MKTKIILEIGYNHQGDMETAKKLIHEAKELNCYGVKFQKWDIDSFPDYIKKQPRDIDSSFGKTYYEHRKSVEFDIRQLKELKDYSENLGLIFSVSAKDYNSLILLIEDLNCKYIKLPSQRYFDNPMYNYLMNNRKGLNIAVSTGMLNENEFEKSKWIKHADIRYHCVSLYPANLYECNLNVISRYNWINGYSSHELNGEACKYAVLLGAEYIERHYTFDKNAKGNDHKISSDYKEMKKIINDIKEVELIKGDKRILTEKERQNRLYYWSF